MTICQITMLKIIFVTIAAAIETILDEPIDREPDEMAIDTEYDTELLPLPDGLSTSDQAGKH